MTADWYIFTAVKKSTWQETQFERVLYEKSLRLKLMQYLTLLCGLILGIIIYKKEMIVLDVIIFENKVVWYCLVK